MIYLLGLKNQKRKPKVWAEPNVGNGDCRSLASLTRELRRKKTVSGVKARLENLTKRTLSIKVLFTYKGTVLITTGTSDTKCFIGSATLKPHPNMQS